MTVRRGVLIGTIGWCCIGMGLLTLPTLAAAQDAAAPTTRPAGKYGYATVHYRQVSRPDEIVAVLDNGATVIAKRVASPVCAVRGYVHTGGIYEGRWLGGGLSHLLEHLVAGGSSQRRTEAENRALLQAIGNNSNAYTSEDHTAFFVNTTPDHLDQAVDLLTGWLLGATITPEEYRREYQVVQRELEMGKGEPTRQFYYLMADNRYQVSPARVPVIGYQAVIQGLSRDDVYAYYKMAYQPNNMVFVVVADLDPQVMLESMQRYLADAPPGRQFSHDIAAEPPVVSPRTLVTTAPKIGQARLALAFPTVRLQSPDLYALDLLAAAMSWGDSSILPEELRDRQKLVTSISAASDTPSYVDGSFIISMQVDPDKIAAATHAALDLIDRIKHDGIDDQRLERAKTQVRVNRVMSLQGAEQVASSLAGDYLSTGDPHFSDLYVQRIAQVTPEQIKAVANKYLDPQKLLTTAMLPEEYVGAAGLARAEDVLRAAAPTTQAAASSQPASPVVRTVLDNGTILLLKRSSTAPLVDIRAYALGGLTDEDAANNGIGNLTMNMLPRGTTTRSAQQIAQFFDSIGGQLDTACGNNTWYWTATCLKDDFPRALEVYADVVNHPSFPTDELAEMKQRVEAAIAAEDANWTAQAFRYFKQQFYGPMNSPYQFTIPGRAQNVRRFTPQDLSDWYDRKVLSARRVVAIYGDIDLDQARKLADQYLGQGQKVDQAVPPAPAGQSSAESAADQKTVPGVDVLRVQVQKTAQPLAGVVIGYQSDSVVGDPANFPLTVGDTMCSGYDYPTGYLHEILRGRGLVYVVQAQILPGRSTKYPGTFMAFAGCDPSKVNEVVETMLQNIARLQGSDRDMQVDWFDRSKTLITIADALDNETPAEQATTAALDELMGLGYDYHKTFADKVQQVSLPEVRQVATQRLRRCIVTISTPAPDVVNVKPGQRTYDSFPPVELTPHGVQHAPTGAGGADEH